MESCLVLLSTYNGEKYLAEQLDSIIQQVVDCNIYIYIRDDGSTDGTRRILNEYRRRYPDCISIEYGENIGVHKSFLYMVKNSEPADFYAFCDQDDVWKKDKLKKAIDKIRLDKGIPVLCYSGYSVVDSNLNLMKDEYSDESCSVKSAVQILCHNKIPGCTEVFNKELMCILKEIDLATVRMHDSYVCAVAYAYGKVVGINESLILYRQHTGNALGYNKSRKLNKRIVDKIRLLVYGEEYSTAITAKKILEYNEGALDTVAKKDLQMLSQYNNRILQKMKLLFNKDTSSLHRMSNLSIKFRILFNRL